MGALSALLGCDMIHTCCCLAVAVRMREVLGSFIFYFLYRPVFERCFAFFSCFFVLSGEGARAPKSFFRKTPCGIIVVNAPGRLFFSFFSPAKSCRPGGVYSHYYYYGIRMVSRIVYNVVFADLVVTK